MAQSSSFDVTTGVDLQEVDNAVNQAQKEIAQRYDFKGSNVAIEFKRAEEQILLMADSDFRMKALFDVLQAKLIKRGVPVKNLDIGETEAGRRRHGAPGDQAQDGARRRDGEEGRAPRSRTRSSRRSRRPSRAIRCACTSPEQGRPAGRDRAAAVAGKDFGVELKFGNYRVKFDRSSPSAATRTPSTPSATSPSSWTAAPSTRDDADDADVILVNTCGFIDAAKKESIDAIIEAGGRKDDGRVPGGRRGRAAWWSGTRHELVEALPEVDLFLGASEMDRLVPELEERGLLDGIDVPVAHPGVRVFGGELPHVRYLKISEGCDHGCAFCAIPLMRGKHRSFALDDVVREAQLLEVQGAREVNLVAQDLAHYGRDRRDGARPARAARGARRGRRTFRGSGILYLYSAGHHAAAARGDGARKPRIVPYLDMPMQHASDAVLARMRRPERQRTIREKLRADARGGAGRRVRTTCIVGFPGRDRGGLRRAARVPRGGVSSTASARSRTRRRRARARARWRTTCRSRSSASDSSG